MRRHHQAPWDTASSWIGALRVFSDSDFYLIACSGRNSSARAAVSSLQQKKLVDVGDSNPDPCLQSEQG